MLILGMTSSEYVRKLRTEGKAKCPECDDGYVLPIGNKETTHHFHCDKCKFRIEECVSRSSKQTG